MASLWQQHKLVRSFSKYTFSAELLKNMERVVRSLNKKLTGVGLENLNVIGDQVAEFQNSSETGVIKIDNLISFHFGYGLPSWRVFKKRKRQKILQNSAFQILREREEIRDTIRSCVFNDFLKDEGNGSVSLTGRGQHLKQFSGWVEEVLKHRSQLIAILGSVLASSLFLIFLQFFYHHWLSKFF